MPTPLDVYWAREHGGKLRPSRSKAIDAVLAAGTKEESHDFWGRVERVEGICRHWKVTPAEAAKALDLIAPYMDSSWDYGAPGFIPEGNYDRMIVAIATAMRPPKRKLQKASRTKTPG